MKYTNSTADKIYNKLYDCFLDEELDKMERNVEMLRLKMDKCNLITDLNKMGIKPGEETADRIALNMPPNSILIYHKMGDPVEFYPQRTGLLIVTKGVDQGRVSFEYRLFETIYYGFYDAWRGEGVELWSGWMEVAIKKNDVLIAPIIKGTKAVNQITFESGINGNGMNLGWSESKFKQLSCENVYCDNLYVKNPQPTTMLRSARMLSTDNIETNEQEGKIKITDYIVQNINYSVEPFNPKIGQSYFNTTYNKPLWWTGEKWVDGFGKEMV